MSTVLVKRKKYPIIEIGRTLSITKATTPSKKRKKRRSSKGKKQRWFHPKVRSGWSKSQPEAERRRLLLKAHHGNALAAARSKQALANVTQDRETRILAQADARYFFEWYRKELKK